MQKLLIIAITDNSSDCFVECGLVLCLTKTIDKNKICIKAQEQAAVSFAQYAKERVKTGGNMRASKEYRSHLVGVLVKRALLAAGGMDNGN